MREVRAIESMGGCGGWVDAYVLEALQAFSKLHEVLGAGGKHLVPPGLAVLGRFFLEVFHQGRETFLVG